MSRQKSEQIKLVDMHLHEQEKSADKGTGSGNGMAAVPNHGIDSLKLGRGLLSFRSRKLLSSLSKISDRGTDKVVDVSAEVGAARSQRGSVAKETANVERPKNHRELWDPRRVETEAAGARAKLAEQRDRKKKQQQLKRDKKKDEAVEGDAEGETAEPQKESLKESLPPRLSLLETFYEGLEAATSLLRIRHQMCTFRAVRKIVESMSRRRFLMKHLAQMKHLLSETMHLDYVRCRDPDSWDERWDLRITLLPLSSDYTHSRSPLKGSAGQTGATIKRRKEFRARLVNFAASHPEDSEMPQASLPSRPAGGPQLCPSSPDRHLVSSSPKRADSGCLEGGQDTAGNLTEEAGLACGESRPCDLSAKDSEFSIVKPSFRGHISSHSTDATSHFSAPFTPYFSVSRASNDSVATEQPVVAASSSGSHFQESFRPFFSMESRMRNAHSIFEVPSALQPDVVIHQGTTLNDQHTESVSDPPISPDAIHQEIPGNEKHTESISDLPISSEDSRVLPSIVTRPSLTIDHDYPSYPEETHPSQLQSSRYLYESTCHFPPCTPNAAVAHNSSEAPEKHPSGTPLFPSICTETSTVLGFITPSESPNRSTWRTHEADLRSYLSPQKGQGVMRSLKFGSPATSVTFAKPVDPVKHVDSYTPLKAKNPPSTPSTLNNRTLGSSVPTTPSTPAQVFLSKPRTMVDVTPITPLSPGTPQTPASQDSPKNSSQAKNLAARCLQFNAPDKQGGDELNSPTSSTPVIGAPTPTAAESLDVGRSDYPQTQTLPSARRSLKSPVRTSCSKEDLCSPSKRTKLSPSPRFAERHEVVPSAVPSNPAEFVPREDKSGAVSSSGLGFIDGGGGLLETSSPSKIARVSALKTTGASPLKIVSASLSESVYASPSKSAYASPSKSAYASPSKTTSLPVTEDMRRLSKSDLDIIHCLPPELVQSVQEKERKLKEESRRELAKQRRRQQMMGGVPKLFNQLRLIFQSLNRSVLPRHELVKSIFSSHPDITDKGEVEERLQLVTELASDYITTMQSQSGELLYRINKRANVVQIQRRLSASC